MFFNQKFAIAQPMRFGLPKSWIRPMGFP